MKIFQLKTKTVTQPRLGPAVRTPGALGRTSCWRWSRPGPRSLAATPGGSVSVFSPLIGPDQTRLGSHWSRSDEAWLSLVQSFLAIKIQLGHPNVISCSSLVLCGLRNIWLPYTKCPTIYRCPYAIKNQHREIKGLLGPFVPKTRSFFGCPSLFFLA